MDKDRSNGEDGDGENSQGTRNVETSSNKYDCPYCFEVLETVDRLRLHKRTHYENKRYVCKICAAVFISHFGWQYHTRRHNNDLRYSCDSCKMKFCTFQQLTQHTGNHKYFCSLCDNGFVRPKQLREHEIKDHRIKNEHLGESNSLKQFRCEKCNISFSHCNDWSRHLKKNQLCRPYICVKCGTGFMSEIHYQSHVSFYTNCRNVTAKGKRKKTKIEPTRVQALNPPVDQTNPFPADEQITNPFYCNNCDRTFAKVQLRREHWIRNIDCRPYGCNNCSAKFVTKDDIEKHVRIHMYKCQFCLRTYSFKNYYDHHNCKSRNRVTSSTNLKSVPKTTVKKVFLCQYCEETYYTEEELQNHIEYVDNFLYICSICFEVFPNKCTFGYHLVNSHESESNAKCNILKN